MHDLEPVKKLKQKSTVLLFHGRNTAYFVEGNAMLERARNILFFGKNVTPAVPQTYK